MREVLLQSFGSFKKEIYWEHTIHSTVRRGFSVRAGPDKGPMLAPLKSINSDPDDKSSRDLPTTTDMTKTIMIRLQ